MSYDFAWHARHGDMTESSARIVLETLKSAIDFNTVLDVGCGDGRWLKQCSALGVETILGIDGPWTNENRLVISADDIKIYDLARKFDLHQRFDLAISLEVAEHLAPETSEQFVANLVAHSDFVLFGAAIPYQGGFRHINEKWQSDWARLFDLQGYQAFDLLRYKLWDNGGVHFWYKQNMLTYISRERSDLINLATSYIEAGGISELPIDIVHPERYEAIASYNQIAFRPLLKKLPKQAISKIGHILLGRN